MLFYFPEWNIRENRITYFYADKMQASRLFLLKKRAFRETIYLHKMAGIQNICCQKGDFYGNIDGKRRVHSQER